jgi:mono/diheme cytochrome c family protein/plastocyanin
MKAERIARLLVIVLAIGLPALVVLARLASGPIEIHGVMANEGGWTPGELTAKVGEPINLRLTSDDVVHGFAIGQSPWPSVEVMPGKWTTTTLVFERPGKYTFYCTRWCGPNHWRMRGTIEVTGPDTTVITETVPLFISLKLDLDAPHLSDVLPSEKPSAARGDALGVKPDLAADTYRTQSPAQVWRTLRERATTQALSDQQVWDLVAAAWRSNTTPARLAEGRQLYAANCAACHGETGRGDGVMAASLQKAAPSDMPGMPGHDTVKPIDFTNTQNLLGASSAILEGKIVRGGMGTGMPYWGPILTASQIWALIDYLWMFQFDP